MDFTIRVVMHNPRGSDDRAVAAVIAQNLDQDLLRMGMTLPVVSDGTIALSSGHIERTIRVTATQEFVDAWVTSANRIKHLQGIISGALQLRLPAAIVSETIIEDEALPPA